MVIALLDLWLAIATGVSALRLRTKIGMMEKFPSYAAGLWSVIALLAMVGIVTTYSQVGFSSLEQFAQYLFDPVPYPNTLSYIPWLYDVMLAAFVITLAAALGSVRSFARYPPSPAR